MRTRILLNVNCDFKDLHAEKCEEYQIEQIKTLPLDNN